MKTFLKWSLDRPNENALDFGDFTNVESSVYLFGEGDAKVAGFNKLSKRRP
jgi:hypothetical protein